MKACRLYIDRNYLADKLGVDEEHIVIGDVKSSFSEIEFTVFIDESVEAKIDGVVNVDNKNLYIRRNKL